MHEYIIENLYLGQLSFLSESNVYLIVNVNEKHAKNKGRVFKNERKKFRQIKKIEKNEVHKYMK